jgi:hypothetical protein
LLATLSPPGRGEGPNAPSAAKRLIKALLSPISRSTSAVC